MSEKIKKGKIEYLVISENIFIILRFYLHDIRCDSVYKNGKYFIKTNEEIYFKNMNFCPEILSVLYIVVKLMGTRIILNSSKILTLINICQNYKIDFKILLKNKDIVGIKVNIITKADYIKTKYFEGRFYSTFNDTKIFTKIEDYVLFI